MKVRLLELELQNFKGKTFKFSAGETTIIKARNGKGKTIIADAISWLWNDKDSSGRSDFEIRPLGSDNNIIHNVESVVMAKYDIDGKELILKKVHYENWIKPRGQEQKVLSGLTTDYYFDSDIVPCKKTEYCKNIENLFDPFYFKVLTDPLFFNTENNGKYGLKWEDRRKMLLQLSEVPEDAEILQMEAYKQLSEAIQGKDLVLFKKELQGKIKALKEKLVSIPARINEVDKMKPETKNWAEIENNIKLCENAIADIDTQITNKSETWEAQYKAFEVQRQELTKLKTDVQMFKNKIDVEQQTLINNQQININKVSGEISVLKTQIESKNNLIIEAQKDIENCKKQRDDWRDKFNAKQAEKFKDFHSVLCPFSKSECQHYTEAKESVYNTEKEKFAVENQKALTEIQKTGIEFKTRQEAVEKLLVKHYEELQKLNSELESKEISLKAIREQKIQTSVEILAVNENYIANQKRIVELENTLNSEVKPLDTTELKAQKVELQNDLKVLTEQLYNRTKIQDCEKRIIEIQHEEKQINIEITNLEGHQAQLKDFEKYKTSLCEEKVNSMFSITKYKLFKRNIDDSEESETICCEAITGGVPFNLNLNAGHKILSGLDVINTFKPHLQLDFPIVIDNVESLTETIPFDGQFILLEAAKNINELTVN